MDPNIHSRRLGLFRGIKEEGPGKKRHIPPRIIQASADELVKKDFPHESGIENREELGNLGQNPIQEFIYPAVGQGGDLFLGNIQTPIRGQTNDTLQMSGLMQAFGQGVADVPEPRLLVF
ncbi:MAG: hypothetical protein ABFS42_08925 [Candidatus Krumholzibacteriota bacterium]